MEEKHGREIWDELTGIKGAVSDLIRVREQMEWRGLLPDNTTAALLLLYSQRERHAWAKANDVTPNFE